MIAGDYQHPVQKWTLAVSPERMDRWCSIFAKMRAAGVRVPIYSDHTPTAANTLGYIEDLFRGGDTSALARWPALAKLPPDKLPSDPSRLYAVHAFADAACAQQAQRVGQVSVLIDKDFRDGNGNEYGEVIRHVAVTPEPVIGGQQGFVRMAASRGTITDDAPVYVLSTESNESPSMRNTPMTTDEFNLLVELLEKEEKGEATPENLAGKLSKRFSALSKAVEGHDKKVKDLQDKLDAASRKVAASQIDPDALDQLVESGEELIESLAFGPTPKVSPAVAGKLKLALVGTPEARNTFALSRKVSGTPKSLIKTIVEILKENDVVQLGEATKSQAIALSRIVPGQKADDTPDKGIQSTMIAAAAGSAAEKK